MNNKKIDKVTKYIFVLGLFLVVLGTSYALFRITLTGREKTRITTGNFNIELLDKNNNSIVKNNNNQYEYEINIDKAVPTSDEEGTSQEGFVFKLRNSGSVGVRYTIYLDDVELSSGESRINDQYIKYFLTKNDKTPNPALLSTLDNRNLDTGIIMNGVTNTYTLKVWIDEEATVEASNKVFEGVLRVEAEQYNSKIKLQSGTLASTLVNKDLVGSITQVENGFDSTKEEEGLYEYTDEEGTSTYAYRGITLNNYVSFADQTWRILRIQEDGTIKLIREDFLNFESDKISANGDGFKYVHYDNTYDPDDYNKYQNSNIEGYVNEWYQATMTSYNNKVVLNDYCSDRIEDHSSQYYQMFGSGWTTLYGVWNRFDLDKESWAPRVSCRNVDKVNARAALITADEYILAGGALGEANNYLKKAGIYWTMSPAGFRFGAAESCIVNNYGSISYNYVYYGYGVRPVITLKSNVTVSSGNGTSTSPYVIE